MVTIQLAHLVKMYWSLYLFVTNPNLQIFVTNPVFLRDVQMHVFFEERLVACL